MGQKKLRLPFEYRGDFFKPRDVPVRQIEVYLGIRGFPERTADFRSGATIVILFEGVLPIVVYLAKGELSMTGAELYSELFHAVRDHWFFGVRTGTGKDILSALGITSADAFVSRVFMVEQAMASNPSSGGHVASSSIVQVNLDSTLQTKCVISCLISEVTVISFLLFAVLSEVMPVCCPHQDVADIQSMLYGCNIFDWRITGCFQVIDDVVARLHRNAHRRARRIDGSNQALISSPTAPVHDTYASSGSSSPAATNLNTSSDSTEAAQEAAPLSWRALPPGVMIIERHDGPSLSPRVGHKRPLSNLVVGDC